MKAPRQPEPATHSLRSAASEPAGASQLRADESNRQRVQRNYLDRLQAQPATSTQTPAQLGRTKRTTRKAPRYRRFKTAYGVTTGTGNQGPHTIPHIGKRVAVENAYKRNKHFRIDRVRVRTGLIPSAGQNRRLIRNFEKSTNSKISTARKLKLDRDYKKLLELKENGTEEQRINATLKLFELNALGTYSLHQQASRSELKGKGERRTTVEPDLIKMSKMVKGGKAPKFSKVDNPKKPQHRKEHLEKFYRDTGKLYRGEDDHSDMELSSDDEY